LILRCKQSTTKQIVMQLHRYYYIAFLLFGLITFQNNFGQTKAEEDEMLLLVNNLRSENGLPALRLNQNLNKAAFDHSKDMADNNYFDHAGLNGSNFGQRAKNAGYTGFAYGENIAAGKSTVVATFDQWKNSPDHRNNILNKNINEMGIGHASKVGSAYTHYWTQIFGKATGTLSTPDFVELETNVLNVYPNPAQDLVYVDFHNTTQEPIKISIANITGQVVYQSDSNYTSNDLLTINIGNLSNGIYLLKTQDGMSHKIVKQ
jgi:Cysteine-rich secretory protein family/Secretion system C-terminal sorting domain